MTPLYERFDAAFPTVVRYIGVGLLLGASIASGFGLYLEMAPVFTAAAGAILFKSVVGASRPEGK